MPITNFLGFSTTPASNVDLNSISIQGTAPPSNFDNALRELMAILRSGLDGRMVLSTKSAGYTAVANDNNAVIRFSAAATLSLTAAATLGAGWHAWVMADGGAVVIDPNASETINGATTVTIPDGYSTLVVCDGANFRALEDYARVDNWVDVASATATDIGAAASQNVRITGTTTITGFGTVAAGTFRRVRFADALTLTHNATSLILPGAANITTAADDVAEFISEGSGNWRCVAYSRASSAPVVSSSFSGRNLIINGQGRVNQRGYVSGTNTSGANQYTLDRWRVVTSGQNVTFTGDDSRRVMTAPAGGYEQVIEARNVVGGTYVLNWTGTATATVGGTARAKGETFSLTANTDATVRFSSGTLSDVQLELGSVPTTYERLSYTQELQLCQRYLPAFNSSAAGTICIIAATTSTAGRAIIPFSVEPRIPPTGVTTTAASGFLAFTTAGSTIALSTLAFSDASLAAANLSLTVGSASFTAGGASFLIAGGTNQILFTGCEL